VFLAAGRLVGPGARLPASLIYALDPLMVVAAALRYPEAAAGVVMLAAVLLVREVARRNSSLISALAGSALGGVALLRPAALAAVPVVMIWLLGAGPTRRARRAIHAGVVALACLLVLAPWTYRNYRVHGRIILVSLPGAHGELATPGDIEERGVVGALANRARAEPLALISHVAREFIPLWELAPSRLQTDRPDLRAAFREKDPRLPAGPTFSRRLRDAVSAASFGVELLLALAGLVLVWSARRREAVLLAAVVLVYALANSLFFGKLRYRITVRPVVFLFAGAASALYGAIRRRVAAKS
jgi:hypothetical protein